MNILRKYKVSILVILFVGISFATGWFLNSAISANAKDSDPASITHGADMTPFWKAWDELQTKHVSSASTTVQDRVWGAIKGLAKSYNDDYTEFFPPTESKQFEDDIRGNLEGVGMEVGMKDGVITVVAPIKDSPADRAGVLSGDRIIKVNDKKTEGLGVDQAVSLIRGPKGTEVTLTIFREGVVTPIEKKIIRDVINIPTIKTELKKGTETNANGQRDASRDVFLIQLYSFNAQSPNLFRKALREFIDSGTNKLILDLRGNPGGYLEASTDMASFFLPADKVIVSEDFGGKAPNKEYKSAGYNIFDTSKLKMMILINGGSASASEILAGALRDHGVSLLLGTKSFGKGSVQELVKITPETSLKVTIARWLTPKGRNISKEGIMPDIEVKVTPEDISAKKDPQMDKALELLRKMI
ncbi:MAG: S41 family peptidase [bacterium]|nr:S41 family peptidase [bacterium]